MKKYHIGKILAIGIIVLFIGTGINPSSGINIDEEPILPTTRGNTLYVGGNGPNNYTKIQDAIENTSDGDTVFVFDDSSPYYENVRVNKSINLMGEDMDSTVIDGSGIGDVVSISHIRVNVSGFTIQNSGDKSYDAGINIHLSDAIIIGNNILNNRIGVRISGWNIFSGPIYIDGCFIIKNNFLDNTIDAFFTNSRNNRWRQNYWNRPRLFPKIIIGNNHISSSIGFLWVNIDWLPALRPYDN
jgi:hypothetical protein